MKSIKIYCYYRGISLLDGKLEKIREKIFFLPLLFSRLMTVGGSRMRLNQPGFRQLCRSDIHAKNDVGTLDISNPPSCFYVSSILQLLSIDGAVLCKVIERWEDFSEKILWFGRYFINVHRRRSVYMRDPCEIRIDVRKAFFLLQYCTINWIMNIACWHSRDI